jgi:glycosyltransferase involved in cell wall biosynthesis
MPRRRWLFLNYEFPPIGGGGGTCSFHLGRCLARAGHEVEVLTAAFGDLPVRETVDGMLVRRIPSIRRHAGQCTPMEMVSWIVSATFAALSARRADFLVSFHSIPSGLPAWPVSVLRRVPHIILFQGGDVPGWLPGELERWHARTLWLNRLVVHQAAAAIANSEGLAKLARPSFPKREIGVICGGADPEAYAPGPPRPTGGECRLLFVGRLTTQKGLDAALKALARVKTATPWTLTVAGDGPRRGEFEGLARGLGLAARVTFRGFMDRAAVRTLYTESDVFVFPSRYEGMPNVVLEAMACGLPVVGTRIAGTEQLVEPETNGDLLPVDDIDALAAALDRMISDETRRRRMGEASRRLVLEKWTWAARADELARTGESLLARRKTPGGTSPR